MDAACEKMIVGALRFLLSIMMLTASAEPGLGTARLFAGWTSPVRVHGLSPDGASSSHAMPGPSVFSGAASGTVGPSSGCAARWPT